MKKIYSSIFLFALLLLLTVAVNAQTYISGFISANTTWTVAGSPYIVNGNTLLVHGYTLTIDPLVVVKFDTNRVLQIDGELIAIGTPTSRITFTSLKASPHAGDWGKIHFADTCVDAVFDSAGHYLSGCIMKYCDVLYGGSLGFGEIHIESSSPYFSHCNILHSSVSGLYCVAGGLSIDSSAAKNCTKYGIYYQAQMMSPGRAIIMGDTLSDNMAAGVYTTNSYGYPPNTIEISNCYFLSNSTCAILCPYSSNIQIIENYFLNNISQSQTGTISTGTVALSDYIIECNKFINNQTGSGAIYIPAYSAGTDRINYNYFEDNNSASSNSCININIEQGSDLYFMNNYLLNNLSPSGSCCSFSPSIVTVSPLLHIRNNEFNNNSAQSVLRIDGSQINNASNNIVDLKFNNFIGSNSQIELYNAIPYGSPNIYADSNFWGTTNTQHIDSVIYDFFDYGNLSVVYYQPPLSARVEVDTSCAFLSNGVTIVEARVYSKAFPNPFSSYSQIIFSNELNDACFTLYNVFGQKVRSAEHISGSRIRIDRGSLPSGIYIYEVTDKDRRIGNGKLMVE